MPGYAEIEIVVSEVSFPWRLSLRKKIQDVERLLSKILMVKESCNLIYTSTPITCQTKYFQIRSFCIKIQHHWCFSWQRCQPNLKTEFYKKVPYATFRSFLTILGHLCAKAIFPKKIDSFKHSSTWASRNIQSFIKH